MAIQLQAGQRFYVSKLFHKEKKTDAFASTRRGKKPDIKYSNWTITFVGKAHQKALEQLKEGTLIEVVTGIMTTEKYEKGGETIYPKIAQIVIFDFNVSQPKGEQESEPAQQPQMPSEDDIPF